MWNPFGFAMPGLTPPAPGRARRLPRGAVSRIRLAMFATLDPAEIERKIGELKVIENWLSMTPQLDADEHQDAGAAEGVARSAARRHAAARGASRRHRTSPHAKEACNEYHVLYYGSGSPFAWRVQLALEHKALPYELQGALVFRGRHAQAGIHRAQSAASGADAGRRRFRALRIERDRRVSGRGLSRARRAAVSGRRAEPRAIVRRLDDARSTTTSTRRIDLLSTESFFGRSPRSAIRRRWSRRAQGGDRGIRACSRATMHGDFLVGPLSAADFSFYPLVAFMYRAQDEAAGLRRRRHAHAAAQAPGKRAWRRCRFSRRRFRRTGKPSMMQLTSTAFAEGGRDSGATSRSARSIPRRTSSCRRTCNPDLRWSACPPARNRWRCICHDPDVPSRGDDVNQEGRSGSRVAAARRFLPLGADRSRAGHAADRARRVLATASRRAASPARTRRAARGRASTTTPAGSPATRTWRATISATTDRVRRGTTSCAHHYMFTLYALDVPRLALGATSPAPGATGDAGPHPRAGDADRACIRSIPRCAGSGTTPRAWRRPACATVRSRLAARWPFRLRRDRARARRRRCPGSCARARGCARRRARRSPCPEPARATSVRPVSVLPSLVRRTIHTAFSVAASPGADSKACTSIATR